MNTGRPLSHFWILIANKGEGASQIFLKILPKKILSNQKVRCTRTRHCYAMPILLCFSDVFLHFKNVFISHVWEVNNCTAWVKSLFWNRSETVWKKTFIKALWRKTAETQETHDNILGVSIFASIKVSVMAMKNVSSELVCHFKQNLFCVWSFFCDFT